jgi:hypothetical protein
MGAQNDEELWTQKARRYALHLAMPYLFLRLDNMPAEAVALVAKNYPIDFYTKNRPAGEISVKNHAEAKKLTELYEKLRASRSHIDWAAAYWAFRPGDGVTLSFDQVLERFQIVHQQLQSVADEFRDYVPQKVSNGNTTAAAAAIEELLGGHQTEDQEAPTAGSGTNGAQEQSSRAAYSI